MLAFHLFRIKVIKPHEPSLFFKDLQPSDYIRNSIESLPSEELRKGAFWQIGNFEIVDGNSIYFRIGKTTKMTIQRYEKGNFLDLEFDIAPYTHAVIDLQYEICAIAKQTKLASKTITIANFLMKLLNQSQIAVDNELIFEILELKDPEDFIKHIQSAYKIQRYTMNITRPNPQNIADNYIKTTQRVIEQSKAKKTKVEISGEDLERETLEEMTRTIAAIGDDASARLQLEENQKPITKKLKENPAIIKHDELFNEEVKQNLVHRIRKQLQRILKID